MTPRGRIGDRSGCQFGRLAKCTNRLTVEAINGTAGNFLRRQHQTGGVHDLAVAVMTLAPHGGADDSAADLLQPQQ